MRGRPDKNNGAGGRSGRGRRPAPDIPPPPPPMPEPPERLAGRVGVDPIERIVTINLPDEDIPKGLVAFMFR